jgi:hypothetical protein
MSELIWIEKNGERIDVHPLSLENHLKLGWVVVPGKPVADENEKEAFVTKNNDARPGPTTETRSDVEKET